MINEEVLKIVLNDKTFGQREAASIVGGRCRLFRLVENGLIRAEKIPANVQNGRWYCNAWDCVKWAKVNFRKKPIRKRMKPKKVSVDMKISVVISS